MVKTGDDVQRVSEGCLEGVRKVSKIFQEGVSKVS